MLILQSLNWHGLGLCETFVVVVEIEKNTLKATNSLSLWHASKPTRYLYHLQNAGV